MTKSTLRVIVSTPQDINGVLALTIKIDILW